jgi:hypothetical protein
VDCCGVIGIGLGELSEGLAMILYRNAKRRSKMDIVPEIEQMKYFKHSLWV